MFGERLCELCKKAIEPFKAVYRQSRYCSHCAKVRKSKNNSDSWPQDHRKQYMRRYMRAYRRSHPGLSTPYVQRYRKKKRVLAIAA